jgi:hypothetical protein
MEGKKQNLLQPLRCSPVQAATARVRLCKPLEHTERCCAHGTFSFTEFKLVMSPRTPAIRLHGSWLAT